jgi:hypothetical protein
MFDRKLARRLKSPARIRISWIAMAAIMTCILPAWAGGCGGEGDGTDSSGLGSTTTTVAAQIEHPTGENDLILRISTGGGLIPYESRLTEVPDFSLYADGRVIITGPVIAIYPGPALPNLQTATISEEDIQKILAAAKEAGLFANDVDYGRPDITDMATTGFIVNADGQNYTTNVYALGTEEEAGGITEAQEKIRGQVDDFRGGLSDVGTFLGKELSWTSYSYTSLAVYIQPVSATETSSSTEVQPNTIDWPLSDLATLGQPVENGFTKAVISGADLQKLQTLLGDATQITQWSSSGILYHMYFRPLLPDETA